MQFTFILTSNGDWDIHRTGCRDITRATNNASGATQVEATDVAHAIAEFLADNGGELREMGYDEDYFRALPCAEKVAPFKMADEPRYPQGRGDWRVQ